MIRIYERSETDFTSLGLGSLPDILSGTVEERRNEGVKLEFLYPVGGKAAELILPGRIVTCKANDTDGIQPFRVLDIQPQGKDTMCVTAQHLAIWTLSARAVAPIQTATRTGAAAAQAIQAASYGALGVQLSSDITTPNTHGSTMPKTALEAVVGSEGSLVDIYGGIVHANGTAVSVEANRGADRGVTAAYGVNLISLEMEQSMGKFASHIFPIWHDTEGGGLVTLPEREIDLGAPAGMPKCTRVVDLSEKFQDAPTVTQLREAALRYAAENYSNTAEVSIQASFLPLWYAEEYKGNVEEKRIGIGDTITVTHKPLGIIGEKQKVVALTWDVCRDRYTEIQLGAITRKLTDMI